MNPFDNTVLSSSVRAEEEPVEDIVNVLNDSESNELLDELDQVMQVPEMEPFLTYLAVSFAVLDFP